ncbi:HpcH/HpaI aldolase/citrate lyase family protein [Pseudochelatococcus lubricantis]|uniref:HpcH/HpaI aldolase/citrate lyase family protein n=1 Tax=Pseudochelatococcus lubricantis TaxID=1538102 RepID=UPI0035E6A963
MTRDTVLRRSQLVTPANRPSAVAKALVSAADSVILDLEDAVPAGEKAAARAALVVALATAEISVGEVAVRINGIDTPWWLDDLIALRELPVGAIVIPKVRRPEDVVCVDRVCRQLTMQRGALLALLPMIETPDAVLRAPEIARSSERNAALVFGVGDYMAETGIAFGAEGIELARGQVALAALGAGLEAVDQVWPWIKDLEGLARDAQRGKALGYAGKWALHPMQIEAIHSAFSAGAEELAEAHRVVAAYDAAIAVGSGAVLFEGQLVDEAVVKIMRRRLATQETNT